MSTCHWLMIMPFLHCLLVCYWIYYGYIKFRKPTSFCYYNTLVAIQRCMDRTESSCICVCVRGSVSFWVCVASLSLISLVYLYVQSEGMNLEMYMGHSVLSHHPGMLSDLLTLVYEDSFKWFPDTWNSVLVFPLGQKEYFFIGPSGPGKGPLKMRRKTLTRRIIQRLG